MFAPSQTTSHRPTRAAGLRLSYWHWLRHVGTCQAFHAYSHPRTETHTRLLSTSLVFWSLNTRLQWRSMASGEDGVGGRPDFPPRLVDVFILLKKKNVHFIFFTLVTASFRMHSNSLQFLSSLALETKATGTVQGHLTPKCISLTRNIFLVIH